MCAKIIGRFRCASLIMMNHACSNFCVPCIIIIEYGSTRGWREKNDRLYTKVWQNACARTHANVSVEVSNMHRNAYKTDLWSKMDKTLTQSFLELQVNMGRKSDFLSSAGLAPRHLKVR